MTETPELTIYEKAFAKSNKTDAILVVDGKKLHVNKAILSYHSDYFKSLFNSDFQEKHFYFHFLLSMYSPILSFHIHTSWMYKLVQIESLLQIADRFQLPGVKRKVEQFFLTLKFDRWTFIRVADTHGLEQAMERGFSEFKERKAFCWGWDVKNGPNVSFLNKVSKESRIRIFHKLLEVKKEINVTPEPVESLASIFEKSFAKSDKTDRILVVDGKKLHVNKAILSYHSDYFNTLFNSEFKEKTMDEIPIEDVGFENFATLLSFVHLNPITPTKENAEKILELADRFMIPCVKFFMEPLIIFFELDQFEEIRIGEKYGMSELVKNGLERLISDNFKNLTSNSSYQELSDVTKSEIFTTYLSKFF